MKNKKHRDKQIPVRKEDLVWYSFEDVLKNAMKKKGFREAYEELQLRRRIAQQVRESRAAKKMTQKGVAHKAGMPQSVVARIESGEHGISVDTLGRVAHALGKEVILR